jgi:hypothetical protein
MWDVLVTYEKKPSRKFELGLAHMHARTIQSGYKTNHDIRNYISLTGGNMVINSKGGFPKIWGEILLLLLLGREVEIKG